MFGSTLIIKFENDFGIWGLSYFRSDFRLFFGVDDLDFTIIFRGHSKPQFGVPSSNYHWNWQSWWQVRGKWGQGIRFSSQFADFVTQNENFKRSSVVELALTKLKITQSSRQVKPCNIYYHDEDKKWEKKCQINFFGQSTLRYRMKFLAVRTWRFVIIGYYLGLLLFICKYYISSQGTNWAPDLG